MNFLSLRLLSWRDTAFGVCAYVSILFIAIIVFSSLALIAPNFWDEMHFADESYRDAR